jgi:hypothetical protein
VRKLFAILKKRNDIDQNLLYDETRVYEAESSFIKELLFSIKNSYK